MNAKTKLKVVKMAASANHHPRTCEACGEIFLVDSWRLKNTPARACSRACGGLLQAGKSQNRKTKFIFFPSMDDEIRAVYRNKTGDNEVNLLARRLGIPRWRISRRALELGVRESRIKEPPWTPAEVDLLEKYARMTPDNISRHFKSAGFSRTATAIHIKRRRLHLIGNLDGQSATKTAVCFGIDSHAVLTWIQRGMLTAERRGTNRTAAQGGDSWYIGDKAIKKFIIENIGIIDIRKVDKFWLVALLTGKKEIL